MSTKSELAKKLFLEGYNCSQSVFGAFCEDLGIDKTTAFLLSSGFGGGFARRREVCGAVSGATMVLSYLRGYNKAEDSEKKKQLYVELREFYDRFEKETGSIICRELLSLDEKISTPTPDERTQTYYKKRPCAELVALSAEILEAYIKELA